MNANLKWLDAKLSLVDLYIVHSHWTAFKTFNIYNKSRERDFFFFFFTKFMAAVRIECGRKFSVSVAVFPLIERSQWFPFTFWLKVLPVRLAYLLLFYLHLTNFHMLSYVIFMKNVLFAMSSEHVTNTAVVVLTGWTTIGSENFKHKHTSWYKRWP